MLYGMLNQPVILDWSVTRVYKLVAG